MVDIRGYNPTNQYFKDNFQRFAGTKTKKGDLNTGDGSVVYDTGILKRIDKTKILQNGWIVEVSDKTYNCTNDSGTLLVPKHTESAQYYTPNETIQVDVSLDKKNKIYKLLRMRLSSQEGVSAVQSNGQLTLLSPSATSILPFVSSSHDSKEDIKKKQSKADGSAIALKEDTISMVGKVYVNDTDIEDALNNTISTANANGSDISLNEDSISMVGKVYINDVNIEQALANRVTTTQATQMETLNTTISSSAINITFQHTYSDMPSINLTNEKQEKLNYTYTFITNSDSKYSGVNIFFTDAPTKQKINILVVGNP